MEFQKRRWEQQLQTKIIIQPLIAAASAPLKAQVLCDNGLIWVEDFIELLSLMLFLWTTVLIIHSVWDDDRASTFATTSSTKWVIH